MVMKIWTMDVEKNVESGLRFSKLLDRHGLGGEFYFCGSLVDKFPDICKKISKRHKIGGHGYYHEEFGQISKRKQEETILKVKDAFGKNGLRLDWWRFPDFSFTNLSFRLLVKHGILNDSSLKSNWARWPTGYIWAKTLKYEHKLTFPWQFPKELTERPWSAVDLTEGNEFLNQDGRIVLHCFNYPKIEKTVEEVLKRSSGR